METIDWSGKVPWFSIVFTTLLCLLVVIYYCAWTWSRKVRLVNAIPGPRALPVLGNVLQLNVDFDEFNKIVSFEWPAKYGPIYRVWAGAHRPVIVLTSPELMEPILSSQKLITKAIQYSFLRP